MPAEIPVKRPLPIIRVFVSSTFSDLKHERNALHAKVWPELERYCQQRGFTFQAIDLRWGVPAEAGLDHRTMRICFEELRRSQQTSPEPNFLILLGNRYGWRPLPEVISVEEFEKLKTAAQQIQSEPPNPAWQLTKEQIERLKKAVAVLEDWYLLDRNAKPFGEESPIGEYVLCSRKTSRDGADYGKELDADDKLQDTPAWVDVQFVLWSIVNRAFPAADLGDRFAPNKKNHEQSIIRFQASATEQEIWHGALRLNDLEVKQHIIAWFREIENLKECPPGPQLKDFVDLQKDETLDQVAQQALEQLSKELKGTLGAENIFEAKCRWNLQKQGPSVPDVTTKHLDAMCEQIRVRLQAIIIHQINAYWGCDLSADNATIAQVRGSQQELDLECADHLRFAGERAPEKTFVGRESELQRIRDYLHSETYQPFVVHGPSGSGKTALLGKIIQEVTPPRNADGTRAKTGPIVLSRFIGTTPESSNLRSLLSSLCRELRQDFEVTSPLPIDLNELIDEFYSQLGKATAARPVYVFLDALDQLDVADHGRSVFWIRSPLSSTTNATCHARLVVSCLSPSDEFPEDSEACEPFRDLKVRSLLGNHELGALDENDARQLVARWLRGAGRSVSETQQDMIWSALQKSPACRQPLFLKVLFEEARRWQSFDAPSPIPESLSQLLDELFVRLGKPSEHGELIGIALGCLVSARYGLSEGELLEIMYADPEYKTLLAENNKRNGHELPPDSNRIPIASWTRLRSDLGPYLSERSAPGTAVMHFYHRQVEHAVRKRYLQTPELQTSRRRQLANYFDGLWNRPNAHALMELPHLRLLCQDHEKLLKLLTDLPFPMQKTQAGYVSDLVRDVDELRTRLTGVARDALAPWYFFIRGNAPFLAEHLECFFQQAYNEPVDSAVSQAAQQDWSEATERCSLNGAILNNVPEAFLEWTNRPAIWQPPVCLLSLAGHNGQVWSVAVTPDGQTVVSGSGDDTIKIWDARTGACRQTLSGHTSTVNTVAVTPDGQTVVSGSGDRTVKIWDARTGVCRHTFTGCGGGVAMTSDGGTVISGADGNSVKIWDAQVGACRQTLSGHASTVDTVAVTPDGVTIISGSNDRTVKIWDARTGVCRQTLSGHKDRVTSVSMTPDGETIVSGSNEEKVVKVWNSSTAAARQSFSGHKSSVYSVAVTQDGEAIVSGSYDQTIKIWDGQTGDCKRTLAGHTRGIASVAVTPDGGIIVSGSYDQTIKIWDAGAGESRPSLSGHNDRVTSVAITPDGRTVVSGSDDQTIKIWDGRTGTCRHTLSGHTQSVLSVAVTPGGGTVVSCSNDQTVKIWDGLTGTLWLTVDGSNESGCSIAVTPDGGTIVSCSDNDNLKIWNGRTGACRQTLSGHTHRIGHVVVTPDGATVVSCSNDQTVKIWDSRTGTCRHSFYAHNRLGADCLALTPDGGTVVSGSLDRTVKIWNARTGTCRQTLSGHTEGIHSVAVAPDGGNVVSGSFDDTIKIWDAQTGQCLATHPAGSVLDHLPWAYAGLQSAFGIPLRRGNLVFRPRFEEEQRYSLLAVPGPFETAYGPLAGNTILAFTANGAAHWFRIRRRELQ